MGVNVEFAEVYKDIETFLKLWPGAEWGPAHVLLSDFNLSDNHIDSALDMIAQIVDREYYGDSDRFNNREYLESINFYEGFDHSKIELLETYGLLVMLKTKYTEDERDSYDGGGIFR